MYHGRCELRGLKPERILVQPGIRVEGGSKGFLGSLRHDKEQRIPHHSMLTTQLPVKGKGGGEMCSTGRE